MAEPAFKGMHLWVADMAASMAFYRMIGFPVPGGAEDQQFVRISLANGQTFEFGSHELTRRYDRLFEPPSAAKGAMCIQLELPSRDAVDELQAKLIGKGYRSHLAPFDAFWGARYMEVYDPDGNVLGFHSPQDPDRAAPLPP